MTTNAQPPLYGIDDRQRRATAHQWLLAAATNRHVANAEWTDQRVALLTAGRHWDAIRMPYKALGAEMERDAEPELLRDRLEELQVSGPVFCDPYRPFLYFLVPPGTDREWPREIARRGAECLGGTRPYVHHIGVPRLDVLAPPGLFWLSAPDGFGELVDPQHLVQALRLGASEPPVIG
ncbi:hypothetical protein BX257_4009 [Streptomyces sp. 3212.3]|uniref:hypothetical protein n=1 Tax=Streptomyces sp. 3212.3 TaxID=1938846 RepID=UPI000E388C23|nr:hypothetical protein [Streptomyces sp. 3212.3]REE61431.1 hypothetical protein BX257_4009 [Streptomyces sp. 3212.3]